MHKLIGLQRIVPIHLPTELSLTPLEQRNVTECGHARWAKWDEPDKRGQPIYDFSGKGTRTGENKLDNHILGCAGECICGKCFRIYWEPSIGQAADEFDLWTGNCHLAVKTAHHANHRLIVKKRHTAEVYYVFVVSLAGEDKTIEERLRGQFKICGYLWGEDVKIEDYFDDGLPFPAYAVPQLDLDDEKILYRYIWNLG